MAQGTTLWCMGQCPGIRPAFSWASEDSAIVFTDETMYFDTYTTERHWHFGDGDSATGAFATHVYDSAGADTVRLTVIAEGCTYTVKALVAHAGDTETCTSSISSGFEVSVLGNNHLALSDQSQSDAPFLLYFWTFGDGNASFDQNTEHFWALPGAYEVSHSIGALNDQLQTTCVAGRAERIFVDGNSSTCDTSLFFNLSSSVQNGQVLLNANAIPLNEDVQLIQWLWDYGDASSDMTSIANATHEYAYGGEYQVCVEVQAVRTSSGDTCWARACDAVFLSEVVGMEGRSSAPPLSASPIPFSNELRLTGSAVRPGTVWHLSDAIGRTVLIGSFTCDGVSTMDTGHLPAGRYVLSLVSAHEPVVLHLLKE